MTKTRGHELLDIERAQRNLSFATRAPSAHMVTIDAVSR